MNTLDDTCRRRTTGLAGRPQSPVPPAGQLLAATHHEDEEGPLGTEWQTVDVQQEDELVVTVCALVHASGGGLGFRPGGGVGHPIGSPQVSLGHMPGSPVAHQHLEEELRGKDGMGNGVIAWGVLQTQPPGDPSSGNMRHKSCLAQASL